MIDKLMAKGFSDPMPRRPARDAAIQVMTTNLQHGDPINDIPKGYLSKFLLLNLLFLILPCGDAN